MRALSADTFFMTHTALAEQPVAGREVENGSLRQWGEGGEKGAQKIDGGLG